MPQRRSDWRDRRQRAIHPARRSSESASGSEESDWKIATPRPCLLPMEVTLTELGDFVLCEFEHLRGFFLTRKKFVEFVLHLAVALARCGFETRPAPYDHFPP